MPFTSEDTLLQIAQHLAHRHLWKCDLATLNRLARTCSLASNTLRGMIEELQKKEHRRQSRITLCAQLIENLPVPLCSMDWSNREQYAINTRVHISYSGRIVVVENSTHGNSLHVVRATITPDDLYTRGSLNVFTFTQLRMPTYNCYLGKRIQTRRFANTNQLVFMLHILTKLGSTFWRYNFNEQMNHATQQGYMHLSMRLERDYPHTIRPLSAPRMALFFN